MKQSSGNSRQQWFLIPWRKLLEKSLKNAPLQQHDHDVMCVLSAAHERSQPSSNKTHKSSPSVPLTVTQTETFNSSDASRICWVFPSGLTRNCMYSPFWFHHWITKWIEVLHVNFFSMSWDSLPSSPARLSLSVATCIQQCVAVSLRTKYWSCTLLSKPELCL